MKVSMLLLIYYSDLRNALMCMIGFVCSRHGQNDQQKHQISLRVAIFTILWSIFQVYFIENTFLVHSELYLWHSSIDLLSFMTLYNILQASLTKMLRFWQKCDILEFIVCWSYITVRRNVLQRSGVVPYENQTCKQRCIIHSIHTIRRKFNKTAQLHMVSKQGVQFPRSSPDPMHFGLQ